MVAIKYVNDIRFSGFIIDNQKIGDAGKKLFPKNVDGKENQKQDEERSQKPS